MIIKYTVVVLAFFSHLHVCENEFQIFPWEQV